MTPLRKTALYVAAAILCFDFLIGYALLRERSGVLTVAFLDVGQGDAILAV